MRLKVAAVFLCIVCFVAGCKNANEPLDRALALREKLLKGDGCSFRTTVTADYGEKLYIFSMDCKTDQEGNLTFSVAEPATIFGITGKIASTGGALTFDDKVLTFQTMADGQVTPVTAPWLFINTLRSGYLKGCGATDSGLEISIDDTYAEDALHLKIILEGDVPVSAEIFWQNRRVLTLTVEDFAFL